MQLWPDNLDVKCSWPLGKKRNSFARLRCSRSSCGHSSVCLSVCLGSFSLAPLCLSFHLSQVCCPLCHVACPVALELPVACHLNDFMFCPLSENLKNLSLSSENPSQSQSQRQRQSPTRGPIRSPSLGHSRTYFTRYLASREHSKSWKRQINNENNKMATGTTNECNCFKLRPQHCTAVQFGPLQISRTKTSKCSCPSKVEGAIL